MSNKKPRALKIAEGTYREDRDKTPILTHTKREDVPPPIAYLTEEGKVVYWKIIDHLLGYKIFANIDTYLINQIANSIIVYTKAASIVAQTGGITVDDKGNEKIHPAYSIMSREGKQLETLYKQLGLSPLARERMYAFFNEKPTTEYSELDKLLSG